MAIQRVTHDIQDWLLARFGGAAEQRTPIVRAMLQPRSGDAAGYWLQLVISTILATLGLALDSTAVVIGAMLIAPLMRPLVELAMGLATGSAALVLRALARTVASLACVIAIAIAITWLLPFHEITRELEARTAPNLLDLVIAGGCALAAAYATLRADADIATTAAGTSVGISLVPPLCATGYGLGIADHVVSRGAVLLFTANLSGILVIATALFVVVGFGQVDVRHEELSFDDGERRALALRVGRGWSRAIGSRLGPVARLVPPLVLLALVSLPLARALREIAHRNEVRTAVEQLLEGDQKRVVEYSLVQRAERVELRVFVVGDPDSASRLRDELRSGLAAAGIAAPQIAVYAVPEAASLSALARRVDEIPPPIVPEPAPKTVLRYSSDVVRAIRAVWPTAGTGPLVLATLDLDAPDHVRVVHLGPSLGSAGMQLLAHAVDGAGHFELTEEALAPVEAAPADGKTWATAAIDLAARVRALPEVHLCVTMPPVPRRSRRPDPTSAIVSETRELVTTALAGTASSIVDGDRWLIEPTLSPCPAS